SIWNYTLALHDALPILETEERSELAIAALGLLVGQDAHHPTRGQALEQLAHPGAIGPHLGDPCRVLVGAGQVEERLPDPGFGRRSEEHTSELQSRENLV